MAVKDKVNNPINFQTPQGTFTVTPEQIGLELDLPATVNDIRKNVFIFLKSSIFSTEIKPTINLDENKFKIALAKVIMENTKEPINANADQCKRIMFGKLNLINISLNVVNAINQ
jgi:hypothetical protein